MNALERLQPAAGEPVLSLSIVTNASGGITVDWPECHKDGALLMLGYAKEWVEARLHARVPKGDGPQIVEVSVKCYRGRLPEVIAPMWNPDLALKMISDAKGAILRHEAGRIARVTSAQDRAAYQGELAAFKARRQG